MCVVVQLCVCVERGEAGVPSHPICPPRAQAPDPEGGVRGRGAGRGGLQCHDAERFVVAGQYSSVDAVQKFQ